MIPLLLAFLLWAVPASATVYFDDTLETGTLISSGWDTSSCQFTTPGGSPWADGCGNTAGPNRVADGTFQSSSHAIKGVFQGTDCNGPGNGCGGESMTHAIPDTTELYLRWYQQMDGPFAVSPITTKDLIIGNLNVNTWDFVLETGIFTQTAFTLGPSWSGYTQSWVTGNTGSSGAWINGHLYCMEMHLKFNDPGVSNGVYELWMDNVLQAQYTDRLWRTSGISDPMPSNAVMQYVKIFVQNGTGTIHWDNVGAANTRFGDCGAGPPPDTTPPTAVTSLVGVANGSGFPALTWVNGTDNVAVTGQNITRCTGTGCTPSVILVSPSGLTTSYTDTAVTAGTVYGYAVNDRDAAGNQGPYAATVYVTAANSTIRTTTFSDTFTRADDATGLGANYDGGYTGFRNFQTLSNAVQPGDTTTTSLQTYNGAIGGNDQFISMTMPTFGSGGTVLDGELLVRFTAPATVSGYKCLFRVNGSFTSAIRRVDAGAQTNLITENAHTWGQSSQPSCEANGTTLNLYDGSTLILTTTDATYASGRVGLLAFNATATANIVLDNLVAGTLGAPPAPPIIATATVDATGATLTYGATTPTQIRVATGSNCCGQFSSQILPISSFPSGRYTHTWEGGLTYAQFFAIDNAGVENDLSTAYISVNLIGIAPPADVTPVVLSNPVPTTHLPAGTTSTTISNSINKPAGCRYDTSDPAGTDQAAYALLANAMTVSGLTASATVTGLVNGSTTLYYVRCLFTNTLGVGIPNPTSLVITVIVDNATADLTPPSTVSGLTASVLGQTQASLSWNAATAHGVKTISGYFVYSCFVSNCSDAVQVNPTAVTTTADILNLLPATTYYFCVKAVDSSNVLSAACSNIPAAITTAPIAQLTPPSTMTNLRTQGIFQQSIVLTWDQGTSPYGSVTATIEQSPAGCSNFTVIVSKLTQTILAVTLAPNTTYCFRGKFSDSVIPPNISVAYSNILQVTTNAQGLSFPRTPVPFPGGSSSGSRSGAGPRSPRQ